MRKSIEEKSLAAFKKYLRNTPKKKIQKILKDIESNGNFEGQLTLTEFVNDLKARI